MLIEPRPHAPGLTGPARSAQHGVALIVALIVLVALTLAGLALMRSMDTTGLIAGNLAFRQAATQSGDIGVEAAIAWLETNAGTSATCSDGTTQPTLECDHPELGYYAQRADPAVGQNWDALWQSLSAGAQPENPAADASGNRTQYLIHRLCNGPGAPNRTPSPGCAFSQAEGASQGNSMTAGFVIPNVASQVYYRITTRIAGPRNTVSFVQTIITR